MNLNRAIKIVIGLLVTLVLFHVSILLKIIPYEITWGGRLENDRQMYIFEAASLAINLFLLMLVLIKGQYLNQWLPSKIVDISLWFFVGLFGLNTIGNLLAKTNLEKFFAIVTLLLSVLLCLILVKDKNRENTKPLQSARN